MRRKLYLSVTDKKLFGVCGGWAQFLDVNVTVIRLISVIVLLISSGMFAVIYLIAVMITPKEQRTVFDDVVSNRASGWQGYDARSIPEQEYAMLLQQMELIHVRLNHIEAEMHIRKQKG